MEKTKSEVLPKSDLGKAVAYTLKIWQKLGVYLSDGNISIDNNKTENAIRPLALGRKNFLFFGGPRGASAAMAWYSLIYSAVANKLDVIAYLSFVLKKLPLCRKKEDYLKLLPHLVDRNALAPGNGKN